MVTINTDINPRYRTIDITDFEYPVMDVKVEFPPVYRGCILPKMRGFSFKMEKPSVSFKTYRAVCECGLKQEADRVLRTKRRSFITPDSVWSGILKFAGNTPSKTRIPSYQRALQLLRDELDVDTKLKPISIQDASAKVPQSTSPGLPFIATHPGLKKGDVIKKKIHNFVSYWDRVANKLPVTPVPDCAAFARSHISSSTENKVRPVWAVPLVMILLENTFASPLLDEIISQKCLRHSAYGMEMMKGGMSWLNNQLHRARKRGASKFLMLDFSAFDATIPAWIIRDVFKIIREKFILTPGENRCFNKMVDYFINTPIRNMDGRRFLKDHGIPSGSMFTNIIGSCVNFVMSHTVLPEVTSSPIDFINVFGDDSISALNNSSVINLDDLNLSFSSIFGVTVNVKKSYWTRNLNNVHYLGYYNFSGDPVKNTSELLASMLYPQYLKDDWAYCIARALGCALASCGNNSNIFIAARGVYLKGRREHSENPMRGIELIRTNPRMLRHLTTMGCGDWNFNEEFFFRIDNFFPRV